MNKSDKQFEAWWQSNESSSKVIARAAFKAGQNQGPKKRLRLKDLKTGEMFRLVNGRQVYIVCREYENGCRRMFFNAKGNVYGNSRSAEVVRITDREEFWRAKEL